MKSRFATLLFVIVVVWACGSNGDSPEVSTQDPTASTVAATVGPPPASVTGSASTSAPTPSRSAAPTSMLVSLRCTTPAPCEFTAGTWVTAGDSAFIPGLSITLPDGWRSNEQFAGEFNLIPADHPYDALKMWKDVAAVTSDGTAQLVPGIPRTPVGLTAYFQHDADLVVTKPATTTIGDGIPAITYVVSVSTKAKFKDHGCPVFPHCADLLTDPAHWGANVYGIGAPEVVRLYLATVGSGGADGHLFAIALDAPNAAELDRLTDVAAPIIASIRLPPVIGIN